MTLDGKILRGLFEYEQLKPAIVRTSQENVYYLPQLKKGSKYRYEGIIVSNLHSQIYFLMNKVKIQIFIKFLRKILFVYQCTCIFLFLSCVSMLTSLYICK